ncbi:alpha/beta fold hydrolase [Candidatus Kaiserbacteria bacterium]|nr:alpha/beta fold hydrolase [Candidatus Kaiserbacteria bacterium]
MIPARVVEIETPKKVRLNGLWFGPQKPGRVIVWVHGLGSSAFSRQDIVTLLAKGNTAVLTFNNRGSGVISRFSKGKKRYEGGAAHEEFAECVDDIDGAVAFAHSQGVKKVFLAGHSTGCQKSVFWAAKRKGKGVSGIILLAPIADYAGLSAEERVLLPKATKAAQSLMAAGTAHTLLPADTWPQHIDAQRFLSLYTPDSVEQSIFSYFDETKTPRTLRSVPVPILVLLAGDDEFADRPAEDIALWFDEHARAPLSLSIISSVDHGFKGGEKEVVDAIKKWMKDL